MVSSLFGSRLHYECMVLQHLIESLIVPLEVVNLKLLGMSSSCSSSVERTGNLTGFCAALGLFKGC